MKKVLFVMLPLAVILLGCATDGNSGRGGAAQSDIAAIVSENDNFSTLETALQAAGLVETLRGAGPFTVFAPTDEAFGKLPEGTLDALLNDVDALRSILLYHVVSGKVPAADVVNLSSAETVQGASLRISTMGGKVMVNDATVTSTDIDAANGVVHVIDSVLIPPQ